MILGLAFLAGFALGWRRAARRGGTTPDRVQYGFAHGFAALAATAAASLFMGFLGLSPL
jgi:hypothetical protein